MSALVAGAQWGECVSALGAGAQWGLAYVSHSGWSPVGASVCQPWWLEPSGGYNIIIMVSALLA